jgi:hypothetical protein
MNIDRTRDVLERLLYQEMGADATRIHNILCVPVPSAPTGRGYGSPWGIESNWQAKVTVPFTPVKVGDRVRLKKDHPCGANDWEVTRVGMDVGLRCGGCGRSVRLVRREFDRRFRGHVDGTD